MAISMVARLQKNLPTAPRTRAGCLPIRNIASGGMTASACVVESSNRARDWKMTSRHDNTSRYLPLNTRNGGVVRRPTYTGTGHGMCGMRGTRLKGGRAACPVPFAISYSFLPCFGTLLKHIGRLSGGSSICSAGLRYNCFFYRSP